MDIVAIAAGERHALALHRNHQVYAWGDNESGQLGDNSMTSHATPVLVNNLPNATSIAAGRAHSVAIRSDFSVVSWGANGYGQLGDGSAASRLTPVVVPNLNAIEVATAANHTVAVSGDLKVYGWGDNRNCQLGAVSPAWRPEECAESHHTPIDLGGDVSSNGHAIATSSTATFIRRANQAIDMFGTLDDGQWCTNNPALRTHFASPLPGRVVAVTSGSRHTLFVIADGRVFGSGANNAGQLGTGSATPRNCFSEVVGLRDVSAAVAGENHSLAVVSGELTASPLPVAFPSTPVGSTASSTFTVKNSGLTPVAFYSVSTNGDFQASDDCPNRPAELAPNSTCTFTITFRPSLAGVRTGVVTISHDGVGRTLRLDLKGTATEPKVSFTPAIVDFGPQRVGTTSSTSTVTLRNDGDADLLISVIEATAGFSVATMTCPLAPQVVSKNGGICTADITFSPLEAKPALGELTVSYSGGKKASMTLRGTGVAPGAAISPTNHSFAATTSGSISQPVTFTVTSTTSIPLTVATANITGDFQIENNTCDGVTLANQGDTCTIAVRFAPTSIGVRSGILTVPTNGVPATVQAALNGIGE